MSPRSSYPRPREVNASIHFTIARRGAERRFAVRPATLYSFIALLPLVGAVYLGATAYLFFRDDMVAGLMSRQAKLQYAYEDRLAAMRLQLDRVTSRQLLDQDSFEGKVQSLINRQAKLETRTALVAALSDKLGQRPDAAAPPPATASASRAAKPSSATGGPPPAPATASAAGAPLAPHSANAFAPTTPPLSTPFPLIEKPRPEGFELRSSAAAATETLATARDADLPMPARLDTLGIALDRIERNQTVALAALAEPAAARVQKLKAAIAESGLHPDRVMARAPGSAMGGPFVPAKIESSAFERQLNDAQKAFVALERLRRALPYVPLRKPLAGALDVTSSFGYRVDPFIGRGALHSGMDMRAETGAPVLATAAGKVVTAGWSGGYGNLVEIDHGDGIATRYGHMSAITVSEGQAVSAGAVVGRVGSTGRSTGPHLHYEVRLDDEATDPARFIKAARMLAND